MRKKTEIQYPIIEWEQKQGWNWKMTENQNKLIKALATLKEVQELLDKLKVAKPLTIMDEFKKLHKKMYKKIYVAITLLNKIEDDT